MAWLFLLSLLTYCRPSLPSLLPSLPACLQWSSCVAYYSEWTALGVGSSEETRHSPLSKSSNVSKAEKPCAESSSPGRCSGPPCLCMLCILPTISFPPFFFPTHLWFKTQLKVTSLIESALLSFAHSCYQPVQPCWAHFNGKLALCDGCPMWWWLFWVSVSLSACPIKVWASSGRDHVLIGWIDVACSMRPGTYLAINKYVWHE